MTKKKFSIGKLLLLMVTLLLVFTLAGGIVCVGLALTDHHREHYTLDEKDDSFPFEALKGALFGEPFDVSETKINTYLNRLLCDEVNTGKKQEVLKNIRLYFHREDDTEIYARVYFWQHDFSLYARASIVKEPTLPEAAVRFHHVKLGELPLPGFVVDRVLQKLVSNKPQLRYEDGVLYVKTQVEYELINRSLVLQLEQFEPRDGCVTCKTNSLTAEALKLVGEYLRSEDGKALARKLFGNDENDWKNRLYDAIFG